MTTLAPGTLLYRGVDCRPEKLDPPLALNSGEGILWLACDSLAAQTYIPVCGCKTGFALPWDKTEPLRPDDGILDVLVEKLGGRYEILEREWPVPSGKHDIPERHITNGRFGRAMSWRQIGARRIKWDDVLAELTRLGYPTNQHYIWLKTGTRKDGTRCVMHAKYRMRGSLVIFRVREELRGYDFSDEDASELDPAYHHAATWSRQAQEKGRDYVAISDLCQTEIWGNVGHTSIAVNERGLPKLEVHAILPAYHREWDEVRRLGNYPSLEEVAWRRGLIRPHPIASAA